MFFTAGYDFLFFKDQYLVQTLKDEFGFNTQYLPQCCSEKVHKKTKLSEKDIDIYGCDIANAGNLYPSRAALYRQLLKYNIKLWGAPPPIWLNTEELKSIIMGKEVYGEEKTKAFAAAKIVLNNLHPAEINGVNKRTFEIPACNGFQITSFRPITAEMFELDKEIVCYKNLNELKEKIEYYLDPKNENERMEIIEAGRKRVLKDHTYAHRLKKVIEIVFN
jgi:spore maturation protein CgeB